MNKMNQHKVNMEFLRRALEARRDGIDTLWAAQSRLATIGSHNESEIACAKEHLRHLRREVREIRARCAVSAQLAGVGFR